MPIVKRDTNWQALRGICIIAVVLIHCEHYVQWDGSVNSFIFYFYRNLINFPVAVFMFLSGYFANPEKFGGGTKQYYKDRIVRLIVPYCAWTIIYLIFRATLIGNINLSFKTLLSAFLLGKAAAPFYYIIVLFYFTLATPYLVRYVRNITCSIGVLIFSLFFFLSYGLELMETYCMLNVIKGQVIAYSQLRVSGFLYALSVILTFLWLYRDRIPNYGIVQIGNNSYGIFYIHCLGILLAQKLSRLEHLSFVASVLIEFLFALGLSLIIIYCINKIGNKRLKGLFGI